MWRRREAVREYVSASLWALPTLAVVAALIAGSVLSLVDVGARSPLRRLLFQGTADDARTLLIGTVGTMITVIALTLGLTVVALQLSSTQFSPRVLRNFLRDRPNQIVLSIFVATFAYSAAGLYTVGVSAGERTAEFPRLAVTGAIVLLMASLGVLVFFADHLAHSIQIDSIMGVVVRSTVKVIDEGLPGEVGGTAPKAPERAVAVSAPRSGYVQSVHPEQLLGLATAADIVIRIVPRVGDHVIAGTPLAWVWTVRPAPPEPPDSPDPARFEPAIAAAVRVAFERTMLQDTAFGLRQLVDIAIKALSPAINDPYTAVQSIDRLAVLLVALARRMLGDFQLSDSSGTVRVSAPAPAFADYLDLACGQIRRYGAGEPQVVHALLRMLRVTGEQATDDRRRALVVEQVTVLVADADRAIRQPADLAPLRDEADEVIRLLKN
jgi:uncharacterized membrane protein